MKFKNQRIIILAVVFLILILPQFLKGAEDNRSIDQIDKEIQTKKQRIDALQQQIANYNVQANTQRQKATTLKSRLDYLENRINQAELAVAKTELLIQETNGDIKKTEADIAQRRKMIAAKRNEIAQMLRLLQGEVGRSTLEMFLQEGGLPEYFAKKSQIGILEEQTHTKLSQVQAYKNQLEQDRISQQKKRADLETLQANLLDQKDQLQGEQTAKAITLKQTKNSEAKYLALKAKLQAEEAAADADITRLSQVLREKILKAGLNNKLEILDGNKLTWPVSPARGISAYFHDPTYIFRNIFEHPAIDIRTAQGTPIKAAASGYVGRAKDAGLGYSYIMLVHGNEMATVYGHISAIYVKEGEVVARGQIIGLSGGQPGTRGAGGLTTGAHLHLEVRQAGLPQNPLNYLP